jgi:hypothetical protein
MRSRQLNHHASLSLTLWLFPLTATEQTVVCSSRSLSVYDMTKFNVLVDGRGSRSTSKLGQMVAVLFLGLFTAVTLHAQSSTPVSVSPAAGSGFEQAFVATYTDPNGVTDVQSVSLYIMNGVAPGSGSGWSATECILNYKISSGVIQLAQDAGVRFSPPRLPPELNKP